MQIIKKIIAKYNTFAKYLVSAGLSFALDLGLFTVFVNLFKSMLGDMTIFIATILARMLSSFFNYLMNRNTVFKQDNNDKVDIKTLVKYYLLVVIQMCVSAVLVFSLHEMTSFNETIVKIPVDIFIFVINYFVQKVYIFKK